ncbi:hypothetical protein DICPUDRAFT_147757 [Dictyostelium purpureum]|uniref:Protein kinase domain-containing protein n=1 Tax=Dictyostelium purpureum TaxID=5786 RepID=F0Z9B6_DICPU|nr:uncharacterized protein DICPUDRAFT_147757 [Dictyostelium purpureum]EGC39472.1 hypothetical protein DICPUDRAFT_147757 [Dictyostelium purpureum]|eukprot:XP_003284030.1 hypothetical protein DICPUDRAFT_147757 [Dictyostelium purpureum]
MTVVLDNEIRNYLNAEWDDIEALGKGVHSIVLKAKKRNGDFNGKKVEFCTIKSVKKQVHLVNENIYFEQDPKKEREILEKLGSHNNLLDYYGHTEDVKTQTTYFYFEYLEGFTSIQSKLLKEPTYFRAEEETMKRIALQLVLVLNYLHHTLNIMHRDITPDNVLIDGECNIKLIDFGQSKEFAHFDSSLNNNYNWSLLGKEEYIAPEVKVNHSNFSIISKISSNSLKNSLSNSINTNNNSSDNDQSGNISPCNVELIDSPDIPSVYNSNSNNSNVDINLFGIGSTLSLKSLRKIDIWSLGCLVLHISGGDPKIISSSFEPIVPDSVSFNGRNFIQKCLIQDPDLRFDTTLLLKHRFLEKSYLLQQQQDNSFGDNQKIEDEQEISFGIGSENVYYLGNEEILKENSIPNYITTIVFNDSFDQDIKYDYLPHNLKHLHFNRSFNKLDFLELPEFNLSTLKYYQQFKIPIKPRQLPKSIVKLVLPNYSLEIRKNSIPAQVKFLTLGYLKSLESLTNLPPSIIDLQFSCSQELFDSITLEVLPPNISFLKVNNQIIDLPLKTKSLPHHSNIPIDSEIPETKFEDVIINSQSEFPNLKNRNIRSITFNDDFNEDINRKEFTSLIPIIKEMKFGFRFNKVIDFSLPMFLNRLIFGDKFNQPIEAGVLPSQLVHLEFGRCFNRPIKSKVFPSGLKTLKFGDQFNQTINEDILPSSIEVLKFGNQFNQPILSALLPTNLRVLVLGLDFDHNLPPECFSSRIYDSLEELSILSENLSFENISIFSKPFKKLSKFVFNGLFRGSLPDNLLPPSIASLELPNYNFKITSKAIPQSIKSLKLGCKYSFIDSLTLLPPSLVDLSLGCCEEDRVLITQSTIPQNLKKLVVNNQDVRLPIVYSKEQLLDLSTELANKHLASKKKKINGTWIVTIENFTNKKDHFFSSVFNLVDSNWKLKFYSTGKESNGFLSVYLVNDDICNNPFLEKTISYKIHLLNQLAPNSSLEKNSAHKFTNKDFTHGYISFISLFTLLNPNSGFLLNNTLKFKINMISNTQLVDTSDKFSLDVGQTFTYRIPKLSNKIEPFVSPIFECCGRSWGLKIYPMGQPASHFISIFLENIKPSNNEEHFIFSLELVNQVDQTQSIKNWISNNFSSKNPIFGYPKFFGVSSLLDPELGFLVNDSIVLSVTIIQVSNKKKNFFNLNI